MANSPKILPFAVSALHEILKWSADRSEWQRDALRRIVTQDAINAADIAALDRLCRAAHGALNKDEPAITFQPLAAVHLPPAPGAGDSVTLISVGNLLHVNRLPSDQVLEFGDTPGLTVIYGDNGTGKSGYARVIKRACRTRGAPPSIKPNAFNPTPKDAASANITFRLAGRNETHFWKDGSTSHASLGNVFVFDASTAGHYLLEDGPAIFTPHGLDVLPQLSKICDEVSNRLQAAISTRSAEITSTARSWKYDATTKVGALVGSLSAKTKMADVEALAAFSDAQANRLAELNEALKSNPKQKAMESRAAATRLRAFAAVLSAMTADLAAPKIDALHKLLDDALDSAAAARAFASGQFDASHLPGTGSSTWRELFEAARQFSVTHAYMGQDYPVHFDGARCVLCQERISPAAAERLRAFDAFCKNQSQRVSADAAAQLQAATSKINGMQAVRPDLVKVESDISGFSAEKRKPLDDFVQSVDRILKSLKNILASKTWAEPGQLPVSPATMITEFSTAIDVRANMEESADRPEERAKLQTERDELAAREWLAGVKPDVLLQIDRYNQIATLEKCKKDTSTRSITAKNIDLTQQIVTDAFCKKFEAEVKLLGLRTISVQMKEIKGRKGQTCFGARLVGAESHKICEVASEGEQRCIALAAFLTELSQASHRSTLVFDDPVSSLDHWNRETIARRLVQESRDRQVVVFTHDAVFLNDLQTHSEQLRVKSAFRYLQWTGSLPGQCHDGLPWDHKSPEERLDKLDKRHKEIEQTWSPHPNDANKNEMRDAYSWLRATLERIIERVVFSDVVLRFRSYVNLRSVRSAVGFSNQECDELLRLFGRCSNVTDAHDPASGKQGAVPDPTQLLQDIADTKNLLAAIRTRQKATAVPHRAVSTIAIP